MDKRKDSETDIQTEGPAGRLLDVLDGRFKPGALKTLIRVFTNKRNKNDASCMEQPNILKL